MSKNDIANIAGAIAQVSKRDAETAIVKELVAYATTGKINDTSTYMQELEIIDDQSDMQVWKAPAIVFITRSEAAALSRCLALAACTGTIVAIAGAVYQDLKQGSVEDARRKIKVFTRHNDKIGYDFSALKQRYVTNRQAAQGGSDNQFATSAYESFNKIAAIFHQKYQRTTLAGHHSSMATKFTIKQEEIPGLLKNQQRVVNQLPAEAGSYEYKISGLQKQLLREQKAVEILQEANNELELQANAIRGHKVIDPTQLSHYPRKLKENLRRINGMLSNNAERLYARALVEPFHPSARGARVVKRVPRESVTYTNHKTIEVNAPQFLCLSNLEMLVDDDFILTEDATLVNEIINNTPVAYQAPLDDDPNAVVNVTKIPITSMSVGTFRSKWQWHGNDINQIYAKAKVVGSGIRLFKSSVADNESGICDVIYGQEGIAVDDLHPISDNLGMPQLDRIRLYLAQEEYGNCRGRAGFVMQTNYRPFDADSFEDHHIQTAKVSHDGRYMEFNNQYSMLWLSMEENNGATKRVISMSQVLNTTDANLLANFVITGVIQESLQQRHTNLWYARNMAANMSFQVERIKHMEGMPDQDHYGFAQFQRANLLSAQSPLDFISQIITSDLFLPYAKRRETLMGDMLEGRAIQGFWSETLFPKLKELIKYGADYAEQHDSTDMFVEVASDAAMATLAGLFPELLPIIAAGGEIGKDVLKPLAREGVKYLGDWAVRGKPSMLLVHDQKSRRAILPPPQSDSDDDLDQIREID